MPYFIECGHTCTHVGPNANELQVFYNVGNAISKHLKSNNIHKNCSAICRAHDEFPGQKVIRRNLEDLEVRVMADQLWRRFRGSEARRLIPITSLTKARDRNEYRRLFTPEQPLEPEPADETESSAPPVPGPSGTTHSSTALPIPIHRLEGSIYRNMNEIMKSDFYNKVITLCLVEDPMRGTTHEDAVRYAPWIVTVNLLETAYLKFKEAFPNLAFQESEAHHCWEWLAIAQAFESQSPQGTAQVHLLTWDQYKNALVRGKGTAWNTMAGSDIVVGGYGFHADFLNPARKDAMALQDFNIIMGNLKRLSKRTCLFSNVPQMLARGNKLSILQLLKNAAEAVTETFYPTIKLIEYPLNPNVTRDCLVIKRSFSDNTKHVLIREDNQYRSKIAMLEAERKAHYDHEAVRDFGAEPVWFGVSYIPEMREKGQIHIYFIGGEPTYMMSTRPAADADVGPDIEEVVFATPLAHLASTAKMVNSELPSYIQKIGKAQLVDFATKTYWYLVDQEEEMNPNEGTDLRLFCRMDISVLQVGQDGRYHYFVNGIAAGHKASLFMGFMSNSSRIASDFALTLRAWVAIQLSKNQDALMRGMGASSLG